MSERLYSTAKAGEILGGLNPQDVLRLIHDRKLNAKLRPVRGKGKRPRKFILESELQRYMRELPDAKAPKVARAKKPEWMDPDIEAELAAARKYV